MAARKNGGEEFGALSAKVETLLAGFRDQRAEIATWRAEIRQDIGALRGDVMTRCAQIEGRQDKSARDLSGRIEAVERSDAAFAAVEKYKRWLVGAVVVALSSLVFGVARAWLGH